jgi:hypothetical protein
MDCGLIGGKYRGFFAKLAGIFGWGFIFQEKMARIRSIAHEPVEALAHGGLRTEEATVARWSSYCRLVWAMMTHHGRGKMERGMRRSRGNAHRGLDSGETAA